MSAYDDWFFKGHDQHTPSYDGLAIGRYELDGFVLVVKSLFDWYTVEFNDDGEEAGVLIPVNNEQEEEIYYQMEDSKKYANSVFYA
jgi:hypothetical protein